MDEKDISILIPTYRYANLIRGVVISALETNAGEIIVSDDASMDGTVEILSDFKDPRLKIIEQPKNVGLWQNHLKLIEESSKPWIKFLHADDLFLPGGLGRMAQSIEPADGIIWANPIFKDIETHNTWTRYIFDNPIRLNSSEFFKWVSYYGNILGTPSHMLVKRDLIDTSPAAWVNDTSADLLMGIFASSKGNIVLLPRGNIVQGVHKNQDAATQSSKLKVTRLTNSLKYLANIENNNVKHFYTIYSFVELIGYIIDIVGLIKKNVLPHKTFIKDFFKLMRLIKIKKLYKNKALIKSMLIKKYSKGAIRLDHD